MKAPKIALYMACVLAVLAVVGALWPSGGVRIGGVELHFTNLHRLAMGRQPVAAEPEVDTVRLARLRAIDDSLQYYTELLGSGDMRLWQPDDGYLDPFWAAAEQARPQGHTLRVLHYGDSQIEMDRMTSRLRQWLQSQFGGSGPGMLPVRSITPTPMVRLSARGDLVHVASFGDSLAVRSSGNYGPMMQCFRTAGTGVQVTLRPAQGTRVGEEVRQFSRITLLLNSRSATDVALTDIATKQAQGSKQATVGQVSALVWRADSLFADGIRLDIQGNADLYALLVDADSGGVAVDNIPMRGCSGQQFTLVDSALLAQAYSLLDVGLVIMQFGGNSVPYIKTAKQIQTYCQSIGRQIDHVRRCCPQARVLFVSPSDMSTRLGDEMRSYPVLPQLIDSLAATATAHGAAYWSIYHAMGGVNAMVRWNRNGLAGADYIHFTQSGADLMGDFLAQTLGYSYRAYTLRKRRIATTDTIPAQ